MSVGGFLQGLLLFAWAHITLAVVCLTAYERWRRENPGARLQYSLLDLFLMGLVVPPVIAFIAQSGALSGISSQVEKAGYVFFYLAHQIAGIFIMRFNPLEQLHVPRSVKPWLDTIFGSLVGLVGLLAISVVGGATSFLWFPVWLYLRLRKRRKKIEAARENIRA